MSKKAFVSGGSRGIGKGIVETLAAAGYDVAFTYYSKQREAKELIQKMKQQYGGSYYCSQASLEEKGAAQKTMDWAIEVLGGLDTVVCNAGLTVHNNIRKLEEEQIDFAFRLDYLSYMVCAREAAKYMAAHQIKGSIIMITSSRGQRAYPEDPLYGGMKAGLHRACESMALELADYGITVNCVAPGNTAIRGSYAPEELRAGRFQRKIPAGRSGTPAEVGAAVRFLASDKAAYMTGTVLRMDGGLILPAMPLDDTPESGPGWHELGEWLK